MNPSEIHVHIDKLVLHGVKGTARRDIGEALQRELNLLLRQRGIPPAWKSDCDRIECGLVAAQPSTHAAGLGRHVASALYSE